jgi:hypothetical protein
MLNTRWDLCQEVSTDECNQKNRCKGRVGAHIYFNWFKCNCYPAALRGGSLHFFDFLCSNNATTTN